KTRLPSHGRQVARNKKAGVCSRLFCARRLRAQVVVRASEVEVQADPEALWLAELRVAFGGVAVTRVVAEEEAAHVVIVLQQVAAPQAYSRVLPLPAQDRKSTRLN